MLALQLVRPRVFALVEEPEPVLTEPGWILVSLERAMICGTDIPFFAGNQQELDYPLAPGMFVHECSGKVLSSTSTGFKPGDRVVAMPHNDRGLCETFLASEAEAIKIPDDLEDMELAVLTQPLATVLFAVDRLGSVKGLEITIVGAGPIGLLTCWVLHRRRAKAIRMIDPVAARCRLAQRFGAIDTVAVSSTEARALHRSGLLGWPEADICIEAVGHQQTTINDAMALVKKGGRVLALGVPREPVYAFQYELFFRKNIQLIASVTPEWRKYMAKAADVVVARADELRPLITHRFDIKDAGTAYVVAERRTDGGGDGVGKVSIDGRRFRSLTNRMWANNFSNPGQGYVATKMAGS